MELQKRIRAFLLLQESLSEFIVNPESDLAFHNAIIKAQNQNPWFTYANTIIAIQGIAFYLQKSELEQWISSYPIQQDSENPKKIAVIMAGNIPLVGFHDALCVLITGNVLIAKPSSKDSVLMSFILQKLIEIEPKFKEYIQIQNGILKDFDAVISTGSDNSARYFDYYFKKYPHIIRKSRNSVAVILETDKAENYEKLGDDIFQFFGLGCRNVSKIYIPESFDIAMILDTFAKYNHVFEHNKYMNNYEYNKSIYLVTQQKHLDTGFVLFKEDLQISSPLAVVFYEKYTNFAALQNLLNTNNEKIQCIVSSENLFYKKNVLAGNAQFPSVGDFADDIDTILFLLNI